MSLLSMATFPYGAYFFLSLFPAYLAAILIHELGHAIAGRLCGFVVTSFGSGYFRPWLLLNIRGTRFYICGSHPSSGLTLAWPARVPSRTQALCFSGAGIVANSLLAALASTFLVRTSGFRAPWMALFVVNYWCAIVSLIPFQSRVRGIPLRSDGMLILQTIRFGTPPTPPPTSLRCWLGLRPHLEAIGDTQGLRMGLLGAAMDLLELGDPARAEELYRDVESLPRSEVRSIRACQTFVGAAIATTTGDRELATHLVDSAEEEYRELGHPVGRLLTSAVRADLRAQGGDIAGQIADLESLANSATAAHQRSLCTKLLAARLTAEAGCAEAADLEALIEAYERLRNVHLTSAQDLWFYREIAQSHARCGDREGAERGYRRALAAVQSLADSWDDPEERARFVRLHMPWIAEARDAFEAVGKGEEAEALLAALQADRPDDRAVAEAARERDERMRRLGLRLLGLNILVVLVAVLGLSRVPRPGPPAMLPLLICVMSVGLSTAIAILYVASRVATGLFIPRLRRGGGGILFLLTLAGWIVCLLVPLMLLLEP